MYRLTIPKPNLDCTSKMISETAAAKKILGEDGGCLKNTMCITVKYDAIPIDGQVIIWLSELVVFTALA